MLSALERADEMVLLEPRSCPRRCGEFVMGKNFKEHVELYCPMRLAICNDGCGAQVVGRDLDAHTAVCPMALCLDRAEAAVRESSLKELRLAIAQLYQERVKAYARLDELGGVVNRKEWPTYKCRMRVSAVESANQKLTTKLRQKAKSRMEGALTEAASTEQSTGKSTMRQVDPNDPEVLMAMTSRGSRPWDLTSPGVELLVEVLQEAAICGADEALRRSCERLLLASLRRMLQAAIDTGDWDSLTEAQQRTEAAVTAIELEPGVGPELQELLGSIEVATHHAALRKIDGSPAEFFEAVQVGDVDMVAMFLRHERANPSAVDPKSGLPVLVLAAKAGDIPTCRVLLEQKANVDARCDVDGFSALHWAANWRHARTMEVLLEAGANPRLKDWRGQDALMKLLRRSFKAPANSCQWSWDVRHSLQPLAGRELEESGVMDLETARTRAETDASCVGFCFVRPEDAEATDLYHVSLRGTGTAPAEDFAEAGAAPDEAAVESEDLMWTSYLKVPMEAIHDVRTIFAFGADCSSQDDSGFTALHHHMRSAPDGGTPEVVSLLINSTADVNRRCGTDRKASPLLMAVSAKRADLVRLMLQDAFPPADVDVATPEGISALALAEQAPGGALVAQLLREAGATAWSGTELRLGALTSFSFDTRKPVRT